MCKRGANWADNQAGLGSWVPKACSMSGQYFLSIIPVFGVNADNPYKNRKLEQRQDKLFVKNKRGYSPVSSFNANENQFQIELDSIYPLGVGIKEKQRWIYFSPREKVLQRCD